MVIERVLIDDVMIESLHVRHGQPLMTGLTAIHIYTIIIGDGVCRLR